jgi:hypothetical protein
MANTKQLEQQPNNYIPELYIIIMKRVIDNGITDYVTQNIYYTYKSINWVLGVRCKIPAYKHNKVINELENYGLIKKINKQCIQVDKEIIMKYKDDLIEV